MKANSTTKLLIASTLSLFMLPSANATYGDYSGGRTAADNAQESSRSLDSDTPESLSQSSGDGDSDGCSSGGYAKHYSSRGASAGQSEACQAQQEAQLYGAYKGKSWDQLNSNQRRQFSGLGIENADVYETWKQEQKELETYNKAVQQQPMYDKVKGRSWDQLSSKEQAYAAKNGIRNADEFNTWKETHELIMNAKKQKDELAAFNKIKYKSWGELSSAEKADMRRKGIANEMAFEAYKDEGQKKLIASRMSEEEKAKQAEADEEAKKQAKIAEMAAERAKQNQTETVANQETVPATLTTTSVASTSDVSKERVTTRKPASVNKKKSVAFTKSRVAN